MSAVLRQLDRPGRPDARWQDIEYTPPCLYELHSRITPGRVRAHPDGTGLDAFHVEVVYAITPEAEHPTHDFWAVARDFALGDAGVSQFLADSNRTVVRQDVDALTVLERVISAEPDGYQELSVNIDTCGLALAKEVERRSPGVLDELAVGGVVPGAGEQDLQGPELGTDGGCYQRGQARTVPACSLAVSRTARRARQAGWRRLQQASVFRR